MDGIVVKHKNDTKIWMEDAEVCREFYKTERITFGMSELPPGGVGALDPGHSEADEVFFCVSGETLVYVPEDDAYYRLSAGEAMLIPPGKGHKLYNIGEQRACVTWSCAPHQ
jgi:uncharacterized cupin superfamily protein